MRAIDDSLLGETDAGIVERFRAAVHCEPAKFQAAMNALNQAIKRHGRNAHFSPVSFFVLARTLDYVALSEGVKRASAHDQNELEDSDGGKASGSVRRLWTSIMDDYRAFRRAVGSPGSALLPSFASSDGLRGFCNLTTRRTGNQTPFFYSGLAAFVVYLFEKSRLEDRELSLLVPAGEQGFPADVRAVFDAMFKKFASGKAWSVEDVPGKGKSASVTLEIEYQPDDLKPIEDYCRHFAADDSGWARFIVYRPSRSDPTLLIKSFLAISVPRPDRNGNWVSEYRHFYWPPPGRHLGAVCGVTSGVVLPLAEGVYLVGGRRELERRNLPPKTLQVMALPRWAIERRELNITALGISANRAYHHLLSRGAIRPTPIPRFQHKDSAGEPYFGGLKIDQLVDDIRRDAEIEKALEPQSLPAEEAWVHRFRLCAEADALEVEIENEVREILENCNNGPDPERWRIPPGFRVGNEELTHARATQMLEKAFKSARKGPDCKFDFWTSVRFGPLTSRN